MTGSDLTKKILNGFARDLAFVEPRVRPDSSHTILADEGYYVVEDDGERSVMYTNGNGDWFDHIAGDYASYDATPDKIIREVSLNE